jgi:hypothetical protein
MKFGFRASSTSKTTWIGIGEKLQNRKPITRRQLTCSAIIDDEKAVIRQGLLQALSLNLPRPWIATNAYAIGRIARHDFPRFWPDLIPQLLATVRNAFEIEENGEEQWRIENSLAGLGAVVKELASVKLGLALFAFHRVLILDLFGLIVGDT